MNGVQNLWQYTKLMKSSRRTKMLLIIDNIRFVVSLKKNLSNLKDIKPIMNYTKIIIW